MTYVKTYLPTLKMHVVNLKRDAKDLSRDLQRLEARGKLGSKTLYCCIKAGLRQPGHLEEDQPITTFFENNRFSSFFLASGPTTFVNLRAVS